jgi:hypothetical protein
MYDKFFAEVKYAISGISLPEDYMFPDLYDHQNPCIHQIHPTVTISLTKKSSHECVKLDFTPMIPAPRHIIRQVMKTLHNLQGAMRTETAISKRLSYPDEMIVFIPSDVDGLWKLTTSPLEVHIMQVMGPEASVKKAIISAKVFSEKFLQLEAPLLTRFYDVCLEDTKDWIASIMVYPQIKDGLAMPPSIHTTIVERYKMYLDCMDTNSCLQMLQAIRELGLNHILPVHDMQSQLVKYPSFVYRFTHPSLLQQLGESGKNLVSSSSCVFKYHIMKQYLEFHSVPRAEEEEPDVIILVLNALRDYKTRVGNEEARNNGFIPHAILDNPIDIRTLSYYAADKRMYGATEGLLLNLHKWLVTKVIDTLECSGDN